MKRFFLLFAIAIVGNLPSFGQTSLSMPATVVSVTRSHLTIPAVAHDEERLGYRTKFRASPCSSTSEVLSRVWLRTDADLTTISLNYYSASGIYAYTDQVGDTRAAPGYYTDLYSESGDGAYIRVFQVGSNGEIVSYTMCPIP